MCLTGLQSWQHNFAKHLATILPLSLEAFIIDEKDVAHDDMGNEAESNSSTKGKSDDNLHLLVQLHFFYHVLKS